MKKFLSSSRVQRVGQEDLKDARGLQRGIQDNDGEDTETLSWFKRNTVPFLNI